MNVVLHEGLMGNMLRSEHIPWNVFYPMNLDKQATVALLKEILRTDEIDKVTDIRIEWAPEKEEALDDNTSFDTYEEGYPFGKLERKRVMEEEDSLYAIKTRQCGLYTNEINNRRLSETLLCKDDYRQIWRNHLLGAAMVMNGRTISRKYFLSMKNYCRNMEKQHSAILPSKNSSFLYVSTLR